MTLKKMVAMGLGDNREIGSITIIERVPGGWLYGIWSDGHISTAFVPLPAGVEPVEGVDF